MEMSFDEMQSALCAALTAAFGYDEGNYPRFYLVETFPNYLIARGPDGELFQISYSFDDKGIVTLGDPQAVETAYVPVQQSVSILATEAAADDSGGWSWPVQIMSPGWAHGTVDGKPQPHYFPANVVAQVAEAANNGRFRRRHPLEAEGDGNNLPDLTAGWTSSCRVNESGAAVGKVNLLKSEPDIRSKLMAAKEANQLNLFNVSIFAYFEFKPGMQDGKKCLVAQSLGKYVGLDMCAAGGADGKFLPVAASSSVLGEIAELQNKVVKKNSPASSWREHGSPQGAGRIHGGAMKPLILKVLEALRTHDAGRATELQKELETVADDKHVDLMSRAVEALNISSAASLAAARTSNDATEKTVLARAEEALAEAKKIQFGGMLATKLADSKLPEPGLKLVRAHLSSGIFTEAEVDAEIVSVREAMASMSAIGRHSGSTIVVGRESRDKVQLAMDAMLGVREAQADKSVRTFRGVREAYIYCTGDSELRFNEGGFSRVTEAIATTDFPQLLLNSMTKRLLQDYNADQGMAALMRLVSTSTLNDYKSQDRVREGFMSDIPTVAEAGPYTELAKPTDEKISYSPIKKGGVLTISEETIRNDDLGAIARFPSRLARAGSHTLKTFITNFFKNNPNYGADGVAWFHATHSNLLTAALSSAALDAISIALALQTEKDSGNPLGLTLDWLMVPAHLMPTAQQINRNQDGTNSWYQKFGANDENIIRNADLDASDANDFYAGTFPTTAPFLEIGFLDGVQQPQIFLANLPTQGTQFTNDQLQYKVKFVFGGAIVDFRPVAKNVVA